MRAFLALIGVSLALSLMPVSREAGTASVARAAQGAVVEVLVFEHADCTYCQVFRRDVMPKYHLAARVAAPPMRFIDIAKGDMGGLGLGRGIDVVPTAVVVRDGREVGRIAGYWGSANFFQLLAHILAGTG
jgi:thioredoxin-related protein